MPRLRLIVFAALALSPLAAAGRRTVTAPACIVPRASAAYVHRVDTALRSRTDLWGNRLLAAPGGPTFAGSSRFLAPLLYARGPGGAPLTASGVYYLPFGDPGRPGVALHVADGSQIVWRKSGGPSLTIEVGARGSERYGACVTRLAPARLADGWLPILETGYTDAGGARYRQESFTARSAGPSLTSFVRLSADGAARLRFETPAGSVAVRVPGGGARTVYLAWPGHGRARLISEHEYDVGRREVVATWGALLANGASIVVPEPRVENAERALLVQDLLLGWRYSIGNAYEEFSFPESVDVAQVLAEYGFGPQALSILRTSVTRKPTPYPNWKKGERLVAAAEYARLHGRRFLRPLLPVLAGYVSALDRQFDGRLLGRERYSSDIPNEVYGLHSQAVVWQGLNAMASVWAAEGETALAATCRRLAARLATGLRAAVRASERALPDGSLFLPVALLDGEGPYDALTSERLGSYWNLVMPYALASGLFRPGSREATGALRYMLLHGSRLLGLVRAGGYALYGKEAVPPTSGTDEVYGINVARFLADEDEPDQLVLSLYGELAAAMTPGTFVSGEGATVEPLDGEHYRAMYLPPNSASNAAFLETLRLLLVHETRDANGTPRGLQLAYATPRAWLAPGRRIEVRNLPTSFGPLSYTIAAGTATARVSIDLQGTPRPRTLSLRLRLPPGRAIGAVSLAGRPYARVDRAGGTIDLSGRAGSLDLVIRFRNRRATS